MTEVEKVEVRHSCLVLAADIFKPGIHHIKDVEDHILGAAKKFEQYLIGDK